jgi:hypothetical protein
MTFKPMSLVAVYRSISGRVRRYPLRDDDHAPRIMHWHGDTFHLDTVEHETPMTYATTTAMLGTPLEDAPTEAPAEGQ